MLGQQLYRKCRGGQGQRQCDNDSNRQITENEIQTEPRNKCRDEQLTAPREHHSITHSPQFFRGQLNTNQKQQQYHAEFG